ncbi:MAG TPA: pectate lyase [Catenuloplanes sp.]
MTAVAVATVAAAAAAVIVPSASAATLFGDTFEGGGAGWSKSGGTWTVVQDGSRVFRQANADSELARVFAGKPAWTDYAVVARVKPLALRGAGLVGVAARATGSSSMYRLALVGTGRVELQVVKGGATTVVGSAPLTAAVGTWYTLKLEASGTTLRGFVDGRLVAAGSASLSMTGRVGLITARASASFDDVAVDTVAPPPPTGPTGKPTTGPTAPPTTKPTAPPTTKPSPPPTAKPTPPVPPAPPGGGGSLPAWPQPRGEQRLSTTFQVSRSGFDGGLKRFFGIGSGNQDENQPPMFKLADGATLSNVIIGAPAGDGVHCSGSCTLTNVWWQDVGEDAATFRGGPGATYTVNGGGARSADDKVFQHNGGGTLTIRDFQVSGFGKLYRACGNCPDSFRRNVVLQNVTATAPGKTLVGINTNFGDTARFSGVTIIGDKARKIEICGKFTGVKSGEPRQNGSGPDPTHCLYRPNEIVYR